MLRPVGKKFATISTPRSRQFNSTDMNTYRYTWRVRAHVPVMLHGREVMSEQIECVDVIELPIKCEQQTRGCTPDDCPDCELQGE